MGNAIALGLISSVCVCVFASAGGCYRVYSGQPLLVIESFLLSHLSAATRGRRPNEIAAVNYTLQFIRKLLLRRQQDDLFELNGQPTNETKLAEGLGRTNVHIWAHVMTNFQQQVRKQYSAEQLSTAEHSECEALHDAQLC